MNSQLMVADILSDVNRKIGKKRKKGEVANPANTLDGLVAKRSIMKRYLTEKEAIEAPSEYLEMIRTETDPDVSTRTCSICGYQGKWVSEMIRHKRVHTNDRPFKCKYCSRTSKWKADLIRHVAKTHGIRVVSKYSRSKTFDSSLVHDCHETKSQCGENRDRCNEESIVALISHLQNVHNELPYECLSCNQKFNDADLAMAHCRYIGNSEAYANIATVHNGNSISCRDTSRCSLSMLKINVIPIFEGLFV
ncbi:unnamed protein product [Dracunculus medinensis]|uniref:C2H2-type domain-containing protein n=1 Tax=Dracunculus medinensis TaxID=318479 RepID=A0A158Q4J9_DRAME|nr:unnamed protein product [Dracunculus medinensis]